MEDHFWTTLGHPGCTTLDPDPLSTYGHVYGVEPKMGYFWVPKRVQKGSFLTPSGTIISTLMLDSPGGGPKGVILGTPKMTHFGVWDPKWVIFGPPLKPPLIHFRGQKRSIWAQKGSKRGQKGVWGPPRPQKCHFLKK